MCNTSYRYIHNNNNNTCSFLAWGRVGWGGMRWGVTTIIKEGMRTEDMEWMG